MHSSALRYVRQSLTAQEIAGRRVLEVGSCDVNGSVRPDIERLGPAVYLGVDQSPGPRVDKVLDATQLYAEFGRDSWDVVISTEMLEHAADWRGCLANMISVLRPGGLLVITTRSPGFPFHGFPEDHWRFPVATMGRIIAEVGLQQLDLVPDWEAPGVFCKASKPPSWSWPTAALRHLWVGIEIPRAPQPTPNPPVGGMEGSTTMADKPQAASPQVAGQLSQLLAERENAEAYEQTSRLEAVDKQLAELGYKPEKQKAAEKRKADAEKTAEKSAEAEEKPEPRATPPKERHTPAKSVTGTTDG